MSIVGKPQETNTVISSWEVLDSPVPLRHHITKLHGYRRPGSNTAGIPLTDSVQREVTLASQTTTPIHSTTSNTRINSGSNLNITEETYLSEPISDDHWPSGVIEEALPSESTIHSAHREENSISDYGSFHRDIQPVIAGAATYVSTQPRQADDIADTIATEFEQHVRRSQRTQRRDYLENLVHENHIHRPTEVITEFTETDPHRHLLQPGLLANRQYREDSVNSSEINQLSEHHSIDNFDIHNRLVESLVPESRDTSLLVETISNSIVHATSMSDTQTEANRSELSSSVINQQIDGNENTDDDNERSSPTRERNDRPSNNQSRQRRRDALNQRNVNIDEVSAHSRSTNVDSPDVTNSEHTPAIQTDHGDIISQSESNQPSTSSRDPTSVTSRSVPDGGDISPVRRVDQGPVSHNIESPVYHPPPTIVQNGISQSDLLQLMSKGLGNFTTEMAVLVIEKLKPEYEAIAKRVGIEVKETTANELIELRKKLRETEYKLESMTDERDLLKTENIKDRELLKREFEKDRLKRVKEFEEKNELIEKLQAENEKLQTNIKDKDKYLKRSELKVKLEEAKRLKSEEESVKRLKDLQKELDKAKGEILVLKSKKRIQVTSAAKSRKETLLGRLNSNHGLHPRSFNGHVPYDEGDEG